MGQGAAIGEFESNTSAAGRVTAQFFIVLDPLRALLALGSVQAQAELLAPAQAALRMDRRLAPALVRATAELLALGLRARGRQAELRARCQTGRWPARARGLSAELPVQCQTGRWSAQERGLPARARAVPELPVLARERREEPQRARSQRGLLPALGPLVQARPVRVQRELARFRMDHWPVQEQQGAALLAQVQRVPARFQMGQPLVQERMAAELLALARRVQAQSARVQPELARVLALFQMDQPLAQEQQELLAQVQLEQPVWGLLVRCRTDRLLPAEADCLLAVAGEAVLRLAPAADLQSLRGLQCRHRQGAGVVVFRLAPAADLQDRQSLQGRLWRGEARRGSAWARGPPRARARPLVRLPACHRTDHWYPPLLRREAARQACAPDRERPRLRRASPPHSGPAPAPPACCGFPSGQCGAAFPERSDPRLESAPATGPPDTVHSREFPTRHPCGNRHWPRRDVPAEHRKGRGSNKPADRDCRY